MSSVIRLHWTSPSLSRRRAPPPAPTSSGGGDGFLCGDPTSIRHLARFCRAVKTGNCYKLPGARVPGPSRGKADFSRAADSRYMWSRIFGHHDPDLLFKHHGRIQILPVNKYSGSETLFFCPAARNHHLVLIMQKPQEKFLLEKPWHLYYMVTEKKVRTWKNLCYRICLRHLIR